MKAKIGSVAFCKGKKLGLITEETKKGWKGIQLIPNPGANWSSTKPEVVGNLNKEAAEAVADYLVGDWRP